MKKHVFIIKPNDKSQRIEQMIHEVMATYDYIIEYTKYPKHATAITKSYANTPSRIYAVGGDGMIHEVVQGLIDSDNELVTLPNGTGNDFLRTIASSKDAKELLQTSLSLTAQPIDLLQVNDFYCINATCCAIDSIIANQVHEYKKIPFLPKGLQYITVFVRRLLEYRFYPTTITYSKEEVFQDDLLIAAFCNAKYFGGGLRVANSASLQDGKMDIVLLQGIKRRSVPRYLLLVVMRKLEKAKKVLYRQTEEVTFTSSIPINVDGERYPQGTYHLKIIKDKIKVVIFNDCK